MNYFNFDTPTLFDSEKHLREHFNTQSIFLSPHSTITLQGRVGLSNNIEIEGECFLGNGTSVASGCFLKNANLGNDNEIRLSSIVTDCDALDGNIFGPFCFVRDFCKIGSGCIVGSHVEITRSLLHDDVKISHQCFIGDATIHSSVIVGAGVVFCNHSQNMKVSSVVRSGTLIGSGTMIIGPSDIGSDSIIGAGSIVKGILEMGSRVIQKRNKK